MILRRDAQYNPPYKLVIQDKAYASDGKPVEDCYALMVSGFLSERPSMSRFWATFREIGEEASGAVKRV